MTARHGRRDRRLGGSTSPRAACIAGLLLMSSCLWSKERPPLPPLPDPPKPLGANLPEKSGLVQDPLDPPENNEVVDGKKVPTINVDGPNVVITDIVGTNMAAAGAMLAPSMAGLERCAAPTGSVLRIRLFASKDRKTVQVERSSTISGQAGRCVIEALRSMELDQTLQQSASPSERGPVIEGLLIFSW